MLSLFLSQALEKEEQSRKENETKSQRLTLELADVKSRQQQDDYRRENYDKVKRSVCVIVKRSLCGKLKGEWLYGKDWWILLIAGTDVYYKSNGKKLEKLQNSNNKNNIIIRSMMLVSQVLTIDHQNSFMKIHMNNIIISRILKITMLLEPSIGHLVSHLIYFHAWNEAQNQRYVHTKMCDNVG